MTENPYQSPSFPGETVAAESRLRRQARRSFRVAALILFLPAAYNYWAFDAYAVGRLPGDDAQLSRTLNMLGLVMVAALIWHLGLPGLEALARLLRTVFARGTDRTAWEEALYRSLGWAVYLAIPGAVLWTIWVFAFYRLHADFHALSWAIGVPAHLLGACWYVPLIYRWYRLTVSGSAHGPPSD
jgi:hypothetical protein